MERIETSFKYLVKCSNSLEDLFNKIDLDLMGAPAGFMEVPDKPRHEKDRLTVEKEYERFDNRYTVEVKEMGGDAVGEQDTVNAFIVNVSCKGDKDYIGADVELIEQVLEKIEQG